MSHMHVITVNVDLSGAALTEGVARLFMSLHPDHATKFRALEYHQQLVIVGSAHTRLAVWLANVCAPLPMRLQWGRASVEPSQKVGPGGAAVEAREVCQSVVAGQCTGSGFQGLFGNHL